jgi:hypothetical protein
MAVKKCDEVAATTTTEEQVSVPTPVWEIHHPPPQPVPDPTQLFKNLKAVEAANHSQRDFWSILPNVSWSPYIKATRPGTIADPFRAESRKFWVATSTPTAAAMVYLNDSPLSEMALDVSRTPSPWELTYGPSVFNATVVDNSAVIQPAQSALALDKITETCHITGDESSFLTFMGGFDNALISTAESVWWAYTDFVAWAQYHAFGGFGGLDLTQGDISDFSRPSPLIDTTQTFTDHYCKFAIPFIKEEITRYLNITSLSAFANFESDYDFYQQQYEKFIKTSGIKESFLPNMYSHVIEETNWQASPIPNFQPTDIYTNDYWTDWTTAMIQRHQGGGFAYWSIPGDDPYANVAIPSSNMAILQASSTDVTQAAHGGQHLFDDFSGTGTAQIEGAYANVRYNDFEELFPMGVNIDMTTNDAGNMLIACENIGLVDELTSMIISETSFEGDTSVQHFSEDVDFAMSREIMAEIDDGGDIYSYEFINEHSIKAIQLIDFETWLSANFDRSLPSQGTEIHLSEWGLEHETTFLGMPSNYITGDDCTPFNSTLQTLILIGKVNQLITDHFRTWEMVLDGDEAYHETLVYEIVKKSDVDGTGVLQRFWIPNLEALAQFHYVDTQVKYDKGYVYEVFAHQLIIGTSYEYSNYEFQPTWAPETDQYGNRVPNLAAQFDVSYTPSLKIARIPILTHDARVLDDAPVWPDTDLVPYKGVSDQFLIMLETNVGTYTEPAIIINDRDAEFFTKYRQARKLLPHEPITFHADDPTGRFEIYRIDTAPNSYSDFAGNLIAIIGDNTASAASYVDNVSSNTKYYYVFRAIDVHGNRSNPTDVYEIELVEHEGMVFFNTKVYTFEDLRIAAEKRSGISPTKDATRYLRISPNFIQSLINYDDSFPGPNGPAGYASAGDLCPPPRLGHTDEPVWNKRFKVRVTSKNTGKKFDINLRCKINWRNTQ